MDQQRRDLLAAVPPFEEAMRAVVAAGRQDAVNGGLELVQQRAPILAGVDATLTADAGAIDALGESARAALTQARADLQAAARGPALASRWLMGAEPQPRVLLDALLAVWPEPVAVLNADGTIRALGPAAERHLGWSAADLEGRRLADVLIPSEDHHRLPQRLLGDGRDRIAGVESRVGLTFRRRDGSTFTGEVVVGDLLGEPDAGMIAVVRPDTASHDRELFQLIFRAAPDIISIIDPDRGQLLVNEAAERILGHSMTRPEDSRGTGPPRRPRLASD